MDLFIDLPNPQLCINLIIWYVKEAASFVKVHQVIQRQLNEKLAGHVSDSDLI